MARAGAAGGRIVRPTASSSCRRRSTSRLRQACRWRLRLHPLRPEPQSARATLACAAHPRWSRHRRWCWDCLRGVCPLALPRGQSAPHPPTARPTWADDKRRERERERQECKGVVRVELVGVDTVRRMWSEGAASESTSRKRREEGGSMRQGEHRRTIDCLNSQLGTIRPAGLIRATPHRRATYCDWSRSATELTQWPHPQLGPRSAIGSPSDGESAERLHCRVQWHFHAIVGTRDSTSIVARILRVRI